MGTQGYAAPEQYGFGQTDARTDIYAMGVLLNYMLVREFPMEKLTEGKFRTIVLKCIKINPEDRYVSPHSHIITDKKYKYDLRQPDHQPFQCQF